MMNGDTYLCCPVWCRAWYGRYGIDYDLAESIYVTDDATGFVDSITVTPCDYLYIPQDISSDERNHWIDQVNRRNLFPTSQPRLSILYWSSSSTATEPTQLSTHKTCASPKSDNTSSERYPLELSYYERGKYDRRICCEWWSSQWIRCRSGREEET